ncbi:hypothetical protein ASPCAL09743 [Aspergillus calidoustus]|uniref:Uncharacterized protein n=1 Tax=Aspergillus calidoustus TaxID=454130 RepID=A0A0U5CB48_ASPCI|nr:hypothetical protein ASPCAL09743 [Aspergillus calidoustus]
MRSSHYRASAQRADCSSGAHRRAYRCQSSAAWEEKIMDAVTGLWSSRTSWPYYWSFQSFAASMISLKCAVISQGTSPPTYPTLPVCSLSRCPPTSASTCVWVSGE